MNISPEGLEAIKRRESCRLKAYKDSAGKLTVGWGHLLTKEEIETGELHGEPWREGISQDLADRVLLADLASMERAVNDAVNVPLVQYQYDALVSFVFNAGAAAFRGSTLLRRLNEQDYLAVPAELAHWKYVTKQGVKVVDAGLVKRRGEEARQWENV